MICLFWFVSSSSRTRARAVLSLGDQHLRQIIIIANGINSQTSNNWWPFLPSQHCTFFQGRLVILLSLHAKTLHSLIKIFQDSLDFGRIRGVLEDRRRKVIVRQVLNQIWKMYLFMTKILPKWVGSPQQNINHCPKNLFVIFLIKAKDLADVFS